MVRASSGVRFEQGSGVVWCKEGFEGAGVVCTRWSRQGLSYVLGISPELILFKELDILTRNGWFMRPWLLVSLFIATD